MNGCLPTYGRPAQGPTLLRNVKSHGETLPSRRNGSGVSDSG
ncbi:hypothetical protein CZ774_08770 [Frigoribacterium sp. JB110]|nr:hypothetical protein CZ774_08770 [Frigoribacterium sp. JB110]